MTRICMWCSSEFEPRGSDEPNHYTLPSAGTAICWHCADLFTEEEIAMRTKINGRVNGNRIETESGYRLPFRVSPFTTSHWPWTHPRASAVDPVGREWAVVLRGNDATVKPVV